MPSDLEARLEAALRAVAADVFDVASVQVQAADIRAALQEIRLARMRFTGGGPLHIHIDDLLLSEGALRQRVEEQDQLLLMVCPQCNAIAPENEKDWPDTECVVCVLRQRVEMLDAEIAGRQLAERVITDLRQRLEELERAYGLLAEEHRGQQDRADAAEARLAKVVEEIRAAKKIVNSPEALDAALAAAQEEGQ